MKVSDLVSAVDIARKLGLSHPQNVHTWRKRHADFPQPVAELGGGTVAQDGEVGANKRGPKAGVLIWEWPAVEAWAKAHGWPRGDAAVTDG